MSKGNIFFPRTDEEIKLLATGRILEYRYPNRRYAVHPGIRPALQLIRLKREDLIER